MWRSPLPPAGGLGQVLHGALSCLLGCCDWLVAFCEAHFAPPPTLQLRPMLHSSRALPDAAHVLALNIGLALVRAVSTPQRSTDKEATAWQKSGNSSFAQSPELPNSRLSQSLSLPPLSSAGYLPKKARKMDANELLPRDDEARFLHVPYEKRWDHLKPVITQLYMGKFGPNGKSMTITQVADFMKRHYSFHAASVPSTSHPTLHRHLTAFVCHSETQYRRWFRGWGVRKRTLTNEKEDIIRLLGRRTRTDASTSTPKVTLGDDKEVDKKQLKRHIKDEIRHRAVVAVAPGV